HPVEPGKGLQVAGGDALDLIEGVAATLQEQPEGNVTGEPDQQFGVVAGQGSQILGTVAVAGDQCRGDVAAGVGQHLLEHRVGEQLNLGTLYAVVCDQLAQAVRVVPVNHVLGGSVGHVLAGHDGGYWAWCKGQRNLGGRP